jgi:hypothetical protein
MLSGTLRRVVVLLLVAGALLGAAACGGGTGGVFKKQYEYEEELYLALDGSATVNVNASVAALVALRGADLPLDPRARLDRGKVRALFAGPGVDVTKVSLSRRDRRRFVHVSVDVTDIRRLSLVAPFAWSKYRLARAGENVQYEQVIGAAAGKAVGNVGWTGGELVAFRMHIPSRIADNNASEPTQRGNILVWEQPLSERLRGAPLDIQVAMEPRSILYSTLLLFGATIVAAALTFAVIIWWVARRGRDQEIVNSGS